jgi:glucose dehydrogenase
VECKLAAILSADGQQSVVIAACRCGSMGTRPGDSVIAYAIR